MADTRIKISKQTQKSTTPGSIVTTDASNEQQYTPPGTNGQVLTVAAGVPTWATAAAGGPTTNTLTTNTNGELVSTVNGVASTPLPPVSRVINAFTSFSTTAFVYYNPAVGTPIVVSNTLTILNTTQRNVTGNFRAQFNAYFANGNRGGQIKATHYLNGAALPDTHTQTIGFSVVSDPYPSLKLLDTPSSLSGIMTAGMDVTQPPYTFNAGMGPGLFLTFEQRITITAHGAPIVGYINPLASTVGLQLQNVGISFDGGTI